MSALDDIVREGKVRFVGLSNFKLDEIEACMAVRRVDVVQYGWNMFDRRMQQRDPPVLRGARHRLHGVRLARVRAADRHVHRGPRLRQRRLAGPPGQDGRDQDVRRAVRPGEVHGQRARGGRAEGHRRPLRQEPPAARAALGDLAPGRQHRARRLPQRSPRSRTTSARSAGRSATPTSPRSTRSSPATASTPSPDYWIEDD